MWATVQARAFAAASCPFTVAHVSLGWPQAIVISGASGVCAGAVNGCFDPTHELKNGKKVYSKAGSNGSYWLFWSDDSFGRLSEQEVVRDTQYEIGLSEQEVVRDASCEDSRAVRPNESPEGVPELRRSDAIWTQSVTTLSSVF